MEPSQYKKKKNQKEGEENIITSQSIRIIDMYT